MGVKFFEKKEGGRSGREASSWIDPIQREQEEVHRRKTPGKDKGGGTWVQPSVVQDVWGNDLDRLWHLSVKSRKEKNGGN